MKKIIAPIAIMLAATNAGAVSDSTSTLCEAASIIAEGAMNGHQSGQSMASVMGKFDETLNELESQDVADVYRSLIKMAYKADVGSTPESKQRYVNAYRDQVYSLCLEEWGNL